MAERTSTYLRPNSGEYALASCQLLRAARSWAASIMERAMTTLTLTAPERERLAALIRKSAESDHDGEIASTFRLVRREAEKRGAAVLDLIAAALGTAPSSPSPSAPHEAPSSGRRRRQAWSPGPTTGVWTDPRNLADGLRMVLRFPRCLSSWELEFARDCQHREYFTEKQATVAQRIIHNVRHRRHMYGYS